MVAAPVALVALLLAGLSAWYFVVGRRGGGCVPEGFAGEDNVVGNVRRAALSPDGRSWPTSSTRRASRPVGAQVAVSNSVRLVPPSDAYYRNLTFSRDGTYIYYTVASKEGGGFDLYQVPGSAAGQAIRRGVSGSGRVSHDGRRLAYFVADASKGREKMYVAGEDGTGERAVFVRDYPEHFTALGRARLLARRRAPRLHRRDRDANGFFLKALEVELEGGGERQLSPGKRWSDVGHWLGSRTASGLCSLGDGRDHLNAPALAAGLPRREVVLLTNDLTDYGRPQPLGRRALARLRADQTLTTIFLAQAGDYDGGRR